MTFKSREVPGLTPYNTILMTSHLTLAIDQISPSGIELGVIFVKLHLFITGAW